MERGQLYDMDIYAWSEQQADALRRLAVGRRDLPNDLDIEHVAEEIEDLGKNQRDAAESFIRLILVHLIKLAVAPQSGSADHWRSEIVSFHIELMSKLTPAMWHRIDLDRLWLLAKRQAEAKLREERALDDAGQPRLEGARCPLDLAGFAMNEFDIDGALAQMTA